jgi:4-amino-4-deoxy-L-arabinose transferase-like glycosyltransferase
VLTETATLDRTAWRTETARVRRALFDPRLLILMVLALLVGALAYQAPVSADLAVGWLGDRLFLRASEGQSADDAQSLYGDEITDHARSGRSRWTRREAEIRFPGVGPGALRLTIRAQGWPADTLQQSVRQPTVTVLADQTPIGTFTPDSTWADQHFTIPAAARTSDDLHIRLQVSDVFTGTQLFADPRPKGIRIEYVGLRAGEPETAFTRPAMLPLLALALNGALWLLTILALSGRPNLSFVLTTLLVAGVALVLALARVWAAVLLPWLLVLGMVGLCYAWRGALAGLLVRLVQAYRRGAALNYGLIAAGALWLLVVVAGVSRALPMPTFNLASDTFPDSLIYGLLGMCVLLLLLVLGRNGLPRIAQTLVAAIGSRIGARVLLALLLVVWGGYLASVIAVLPYVGHADYADNAVVARNLLAGRGWVVDYVTQFFQLYDGVTRPQETWPLLQPVWIVPFFALFGPTAWAAKLPNLIFMLGLGLALFTVATRLWDRRVGLTVTLLILTSQLFFKLVIYATSDLAFVLFSFGAIWWLYRATTAYLPSPPSPLSHTEARGKYLLGSGILTGLMLLQKPGSGGVIALGMGLWLIGQVVRQNRAKGQERGRRIVAVLAPIVLWGAVAGMLVAPLLVRNLLTFGKLYYSTEGHDAWILEYTEWDKIYAVYTPELGGEGTPDRSWILRWGFDRTLTKIGHQFIAIRDYLVPGWQGLPPGLDVLAGRGDKDSRLLFDTGAWLALLGGIGALATRRKLIGLLLAAFVPYMLFLALYWHANEERYFVVVLPWLALLAAAALWRGYDRIAAIGDGRWAPLGMAMAITAIALIMQPSWAPIDEKVRSEPQLYAADLDAYAWLKANTPQDAVMMTRNPWQLNWQSQRPALMIPYTVDRQTLLNIAQHYHARYLVLDSLQRPEPEVRALINAMLSDPTLGFREAYRTPTYVAEYNGVRKELVTEVYAFPDNYGGVAAIR